LNSDNLKQAVKEHPEFREIKELLIYIEDNGDLDTTDKEAEFIDVINEISQPYMKTVLEENKNLTTLYNSLVPVHDFYLSKANELAQKDSELLKQERGFTDVVKAISKKQKLLDAIQHNTDYAQLYNSIVELFNHYVKKIELSKSLKDI